VTGSFQRYLRAKQTVDDRALDRRLVTDLRDQLRARAETTDGPLRVLEIGAGIGTMLTRAIEWDILPTGPVHYTAVDLQSENVRALRTHLSAWADDRDVTLSDGDRLVLDSSDRHIEVEPVVADAAAYTDRTETAYDLLIGVALLDILDRAELGALLGALAPGGRYYFPITFDGATRFRPSHPADAVIEARYHDHMDQKPGGASRAGGDVLARLQAVDGGTVLGVAGSDWVVRPVDGRYPGDEAYFLRHILDSIERAVGEMTDGDCGELQAWLACRRSQVAAGELLYLTHQLDFLGRVDDPTLVRS